MVYLICHDHVVDDRASGTTPQSKSSDQLIDLEASRFLPLRQQNNSKSSQPYTNLRKRVVRSFTEMICTGRHVYIHREWFLEKLELRFQFSEN